MINIVCVKWGTKYGAEYVNILFDMVNRNLTVGGDRRFICFTDDPTGIDATIQVRALPGDLEGWWNKLYLFKEGVFDEGDKVIYLDLDTVITGDMDKIIAYEGNFAILQDFYRPEGLQSSVMLWKAQKNTFIWDNWDAAGRPKTPGGDQLWIESCRPFPTDILQEIFPMAFVSYKVHCRTRLPKNVSVVVFHGEPRPHEAEEEWVKLIWKIGGAGCFDYDLGLTVIDAKKSFNIIHSVKLGLQELKSSPPHEGHAVIVGGGPSLAECLDELRWRAENGQHIFAINNTYQYLIERGIQPDFHLMSDGRPENADFVPKSILGETPKYPELLYASQCAPEAFEMAKRTGFSTILWHHLDAFKTLDDIGRKDNSTVFINAGATTGLAAMAIAHCMGFRKLHVYGLDSSYADNKDHHAYEQALNDNENTLEVDFNGKKFVAAPWMIQQANEFQSIAKTLVEGGNTIITVHGEGLLPAMANAMVLSPSPNAIIEHAGFWWPQGHNYIDIMMREVEDAVSIIEHCAGRTVAVQAGGNVGLWANAFAGSFDTVYTFEPDALNFKCLNLNVSHQNVIKMQAALGLQRGCISMEITPGNCGAHMVQPNSKIANAPMLRIDDLALHACDLIQLDVEGYEFYALQGAIETILKFHPVIVVEDKGICTHYGLQEHSVRYWLEAMGYAVVERLNRDLVYKFKQE